MREIVLDTETTGLDPKAGHKIVEIGCIELINHMPTGNTYHQYINPQRDMPMEAFNIHGLSSEFLKGQPLFKDIMYDFLDFIKKSPLIIHNAKFDMKFLNAELTYEKKRPLSMDRTLDTVKMARQKFPGSPANLDALCRRFNIDNSNRALHGALLDSELLAEVYLELIGGKQPGFNLVDKRVGAMQDAQQNTPHETQQTSIQPRNFPVSEEEKKAHQKMTDAHQFSLWDKVGV